MARSFNGSSQHGIYTGHAISGRMSSSVGSFACWHKPTGTPASAGQPYDLPGLIADAGGYVGLQRGTYGGNDKIYAFNYDGGTQSVGFTYTNNAWVHCGWMHTGGNLYVYKNGVQAGSVASGNTASMGGIIRVAASWNTSAFLQGDLAELVFWDVALDDAEWAALGKGCSPLLIRPDHVTLCSPIGRESPGQELIIGAGLDYTGSPGVADHPPIFQASSRSVRRWVAPVGGGDLSATLQENVHVTEAVTPARGLTASLQEDLHVTDVVTASLGTSASLQENVHVTDAITVVLGLTASLQEDIHVADSVTPSLTGNLTASLSELVKLDDIGDGLVQLIGVIHITDTVTAVMGGSGVLSASVSEAIKLDDIGDGVVQLIGVIHITDTITASMGAPGALNASPSESLKLADASDSYADLVQDELILIADTVTASMGAAGALSASVADESLHVTDTLIASRGLTAVVQEDLHVTESVSALLNALEASPAESVHVTDVVLVSMGNNLAVLVTEEMLHVTDASTLSLNPEEILAPESLKISDVLTASLDWAAALAEAIKVSDTVTTLLNPLDTPVPELLHVTDTVLASMGNNLFVQVTDEALHVTDTVSQTLSPLQIALTDEAVHVTDSVQSSRDLTATPAESLKITDAVSFGLEIQASLSDSLTVSDTVTASLGLSVLVTDTLYLTDTATPTLNPLNTSVSEVVHVRDVLLLDAIGTLLAVASETLAISDSVGAAEGIPAVADILVLIPADDVVVQIPIGDLVVDV